MCSDKRGIYYIIAVTFHNLLTAMIKSLWSLKVIRGSERHLVRKQKSCDIFPEGHGSFECSYCESAAALNAHLTPGSFLRGITDGIIIPDS